MPFTTSLLHAAPVRWRPALLLLAASRGWRAPLVFWALGVPIVALAARDRADLGMSVLLFVPPLSALALFGALYPQARRPAVWTTLFARAGSGCADLWRASAATTVLYAFVTGSLGVATFLGLRAGMPLDAEDVARIVSFAIVWAVLCGLAAMVVTATVRRGAAGVLVLWLAMPAFLRMLPIAEPARRTLEAMAPPLEAAVRLHAAWAGQLPDLAPWFAWQLLGFIAFAVTVLWHRVRRIAQAPDAVE